MAHNLTAPITIANATRIISQRPAIDDDASVMVVGIELRTTVGTDFVVSRKVLQIRNGQSDRLIKVTTPPAGTSLEDLIAVQQGAVSTPTGFTTALAAWAGGGATANGKRNALEAEMRTLGIIDPVTLAGT